MYTKGPQNSIVVGISTPSLQLCVSDLKTWFSTDMSRYNHRSRGFYDDGFLEIYVKYWLKVACTLAVTSFSDIPHKFVNKCSHFDVLSKN